MIGETLVLANCGCVTPICQTLNQARYHISLHCLAVIIDDGD
jgi:hypothetical protein